MKRIFKESLLKSILVTTTITLAIASILVLIHACIGNSENHKMLLPIDNCINTNEDCEDRWEKEEDSNWWRDDYSINSRTYNKLKELYDQDQALALYTRKDHYESSIVWFEFYRNLVLFNLGLGIIIGIILHIAYNNKKEKKKKN